MSNTCDPDETRIDFVKNKDIGIACTPACELSTSHGYPSAFQFQRAGCRVGLGVDSSAICSGDIGYAVRLALQNQRTRDNAERHQRGKLPKSVRAQVDEALHIGVLGGAEAIRRANDIGSLEPEKHADIVLVGTDPPSMVSSVNYGSAIITHSHPSEVNTVFVNGEIAKRAGKLLRVD